MSKVLQKENSPARRWVFWFNGFALGLGLSIFLAGLGLFYAVVAHSTTDGHYRARMERRERWKRRQNLPAAFEKISVGMKWRQVRPIVGEPEETEILDPEDAGPGAIAQVWIYKRRGRTLWLFLNSLGVVVSKKLE